MWFQFSCRYIAQDYIGSAIVGQYLEVFQWFAAFQFAVTHDESWQLP